MFETNTDSLVYWLIGVVAVLILILLFGRAVSFFYDFSRELRYLNNEINRTDDHEREYYLYKRRRLWLSLLPFVKYR